MITTAYTLLYIGAAANGMVLMIEGRAAAEMLPDVARLVGRELALLSLRYYSPDEFRIDNITLVHCGAFIRLRDCRTGAEFHLPGGQPAADWGRAFMQFAAVAERLAADPFTVTTPPVLARAN